MQKNGQILEHCRKKGFTIHRPFAATKYHLIPDDPDLARHLIYLSKRYIIIGPDTYSKSDPDLYKKLDAILAKKA